MNDARSAVLDFALREHFDAPEPRDVAWRVVRALQEPAGLAAEDGAQASPSSLASAAPAVRPWLARAAVALVLAALAAWLGRAASPDGLSVAGASPPVELRDEAGRVEVSTRIAASRWATASRRSEVRLPNETSFTAEPDTVFRWSPPGAEGGPTVIEVLAGTVDVRTRDAVTVACATGTLELTPASRARFHVAPGRGLASPTTLTPDPSMKLDLPSLAPTVTATLLAGAGLLLCGGPPHALELETPLTIDPTYGEAAAPTWPLFEDEEGPFAGEAGTWDVYEPHDASEPNGVETVRVGPHPHSLLIDTETNRDGRTSAAHQVLKYEAGNGRITGSLVDSFGGPVGVARGELTDGGGRVVELYRVDGTAYGLRTVVRWIDDDERRSVFQFLEDGEWKDGREVRYRRRPEPKASDLAPKGD